MANQTPSESMQDDKCFDCTLCVYQTTTTRRWCILRAGNKTVPAQSCPDDIHAEKSGIGAATHIPAVHIEKKNKPIFSPKP